MARLLIVSRSMALAMRLADQHDVVEHPADELDNLLPHLDADVLVLDLGDPVLAVNTVNSLREADQVIPVLLVSGYQPEWEQVEAQQVDGVHVVPLPITRMALLQGVAVLTGEDPAITFIQTEDSLAAASKAAAPPEPAGTEPTAEAGSDDGSGTAAAAGSESANGSESDDESDESRSDEWRSDDGPARTEPAAGPAPTDQTSSRTQPVRPTSPAARTMSTADSPATAPAAPAWPADNPAGRGTPGGSPNRVAAAAPQLTPPAPVNPPSWGMPPRTGEVPAVTRSDEVAGVSYSSSITRPFDQEPRTGQLPISNPAPQAPAEPPRWPRHAPGQNSANAPEARTTGPDPLPGTTNGNAMARRMQRLGNRPRKLQRRGGPADFAEPRTPTGMGLVTDPLGPRTDPYGFPSSDLDRRLDADAAATATRGGAENGFALRTAELVRMLHERAGDLYSVSDTAQVLADDVIERADADAAAILVPDGPIWRVSGGVGLRPLERRLELEEQHWLITEIGSAGRAVLIEDTDIIRQQLSGAPLAAWRHLLAVPIPDIRGIVVLARGKEGGPFTDRDLSAVIAPVREAASLLAQAVETRRLARMLSPLRESDGDPAPRRAT